MYHLIYGILYLLSLLPWRVLYFISDGFYLLLYYVIGYRRKVVMGNLQIAFPEKTEAERVGIAKKFYHNFLDNFIETIKLISITREGFKKRVSGNFEIFEELPEETTSVAIFSGHFFNWEFMNLGVALQTRFFLISLYLPVKNKVFDKIMLKIRSKFGSTMISATDFRRQFIPHAKKKFILGLIADQNPGDPKFAYWVPFFGQPAPFVKGPEKSAKGNNSAVLFLNIYSKKRGYYQFDYKLLTTVPKSYTEGHLTKELISLTEDAIKQNPSNYLWSHRRWKWKFNEEEFGHLLVK
jgi:Kdo2-lipid IVA lauroyltransferase/acyltransferase